jgi:hypothetical protein
VPSAVEGRSPNSAILSPLCLLNLLCLPAFRRHPEERSDEERFSIARFSSDSSFFVSQFQ